MSAIVWRACADRARSRSRSTTIVSPSPPSSSNCTSPISASSISEFASFSSRVAWPISLRLLLVEEVALRLQELDVEVLRVGDAVLAHAAWFGQVEAVRRRSERRPIGASGAASVACAASWRSTVLRLTACRRVGLRLLADLLGHRRAWPAPSWPAPSPRPSSRSVRFAGAALAGALLAGCFLRCWPA